jgi:hypothetical protein
MLSRIGQPASQPVKLYAPRPLQLATQKIVNAYTEKYRYDAISDVCHRPSTQLNTQGGDSLAFAQERLYVANPLSCHQTSET